MTTLTLGIGNNLLTDEGIGTHVVTYLSKHHPGVAGLTYLDGGTLSFTLAGPIADHDNLIVVDAARFGAEPGTLKTWINDEMDGYLSGNRQSVHEVGLVDLLDIARLSGTFPINRALIGIQPQSMDWGEQPSPNVRSVIPAAAKAVLALHLGWQRR